MSAANDSYGYGYGDGIGEDNPDKAALDALHASALAIAQAKSRGDTAAEAAARTQFNQLASVYQGFTQATLDAELAKIQASSDPLGIKTLGNGLMVAGAVAVAAYLLFNHKGRGALNWG